MNTSDNHTDRPLLHDPWLVAVWPGMGSVALTAGAYLVDRFGLDPVEPLRGAADHYELKAVEVRDGVIRPPWTPGNNFFAWKNPDPEGQDLLLFVGEAQPHRDAQAYCRKLLVQARRYGVSRVFTFAAMVTDSSPDKRPDLFAVASSRELLEEVSDAAGSELPTLSAGAIGGLNGALLGVAAADGLPAIGLMGEVPSLAANIPYPKASLAVLELFCELAGIELDLSRLAEQGVKVELALLEVIERARKLSGGERPGEGDERPDWLPAQPEPEDEPEEAEAAPGDRLEPEDLAQIEELFLNAAADRSLAAELKEQLDRKGVFKAYEDRFLDLFRKSA